MRHIIQKQLIELDLKNRDDIFVIQQKASDYNQKYILPALGKIFDSISNENEVIRINRLEIDLGSFHWDKAVGELKMEGIYDILKKEIETQLKISDNPSRYQSEESLSALNLSKVPLALNAGGQWLYYMQHGILSWNTPVINDEWRTLVLEALATEFSLVAILRKLIAEDKKALIRIVHDHDEIFLVKLTAILSAKEQTLLPGVVQELRLIYMPAGQAGKPEGLKGERGMRQFKIWQKILQYAATSPDGSTTLQMAENLLQASAEGGELKYAELLQVKNQLDLLKTGVTGILKKISGDNSETVTESLLRIDEYKKDTPELKKSDTQQQQDARKAGKEKESRPLKTSKKKNKPVEEEPGPAFQDITAQETETDLPVFTDFSETVPEEGLFVQYAGLVLLHPFLRFLFKNTGLTEEGKFINREKQEKAILLLYYLATSHTNTEDYLLAVPKILCCWPLDEPLESAPELSGQEMIEADDLLGAAIAQWTIIKNTSAEGLREGFLHRTGKVFLKNENVYIQVEKSGIDILLDQLPWNLSIIKLPWIKELIRVEWR